MREKKTKLRTKIFQKNTTQREVGKKAGISEAIISMIVNGKYIPDDRQKERIAHALDCKAKDLF